MPPGPGVRASYAVADMFTTSKDAVLPYDQPSVLQWNILRGSFIDRAA